MKKLVMREKVLIAGAVAALAAMLFVTGCGSGTAQENIEAGLARLKDGDYKGAARKLETAAQLSPSNATVYCNLGIAYWKLGKTESAIQSLKTAADLDDSDARVFEFLGQVYLEDGKLDEARSSFDNSFRRASPNPRLLTSMAIVEMNAAKTEVALTFLLQAIEMDAKYPPALYNMAVLQRDGFNKPDEAVRFFQRYVNIAPDDSRADEARRYIAMYRNDQATGRIKPDKQAAEEQKEEGMSEKEKETHQMYMDAKKYIGITSGRKPSQCDHLIASARTAADKEIYDEALVLLNQALKRDPSNADALWSLAVLYEKHLKYQDSAALVYKRFDQQFPEDSRSNNQWQKQKEAKPPAQPAGEKSPAQQAFLEGVRCYNSQNYDGAIAANQKALQFDEKFSEAAFNLGLAWKAKGDLKNALDAFLLALKSKPDMIKANYMAGVVYVDLKENAKASDYLNRALSNDPNYSMAHLVLARVSIAERQNAKARQHYERFTELAPDSPFADEAKSWLESNKR
jgi:tetratricopeptide (TPR) repeat protein